MNVLNSKKKSLVLRKYPKIISKNLSKYQTTREKYNISIIHSIVFDQKNHLVAEFKNYLLWDETSEFLKRFYKKKESKNRIPRISEYYEKYTLYAPVYFGFDSQIVLIMNKFCKRKKKYLEYIEEHEDDYKIKKKNKSKNFEPLIKPELLENSRANSTLTIKTIDLTQYKDNSKLNISLGELLDNLSVSNDVRNTKKKKRISKIEPKKNNIVNQRLIIQANDVQNKTPEKNKKNNREISVESESSLHKNSMNNQYKNTKKVITINKLNLNQLKKENETPKNSDFKKQLKSLTERYNMLNNIDEPLNYRLSRIIQNRINTMPSKETTPSNISNNIVSKHSRHHLVLKQEQNDKKELNFIQNLNQNYGSYSLTPRKNQIKKTKTTQKINLNLNVNINLNYNIDKNRNSRSIGNSNKNKLIINPGENLDYYPNIFQKQMGITTHNFKNNKKKLSVAKTEATYQNLEKFSNYYQIGRKSITNRDNKEGLIRKLLSKNFGNIYK